MKNKKIRVERPLTKINADKKVPELETGDSPSFSFIHLTRSGKFRLESLDPAVYREACALFYEKMNQLSSESWTNILAQPKSEGTEKIDFREIRISPSGIRPAKDEGVWSFRFGKGKIDYRILAIRKKADPTLYVIGFDLAHNAYDHGS